uniref:(northern house mosquito) hypothetical protein n=1 Tax=Culex pipiens TaxID=7175 RepID=A0A8D8CBL6_CULPI
MDSAEFCWLLQQVNSHTFSSGFALAAKTLLIGVSHLLVSETLFSSRGSSALAARITLVGVSHWLFSETLLFGMPRRSHTFRNLPTGACSRPFPSAQWPRRSWICEPSH